MNLIGKRFGRLTVIGDSKTRAGYVICKCDCGNTEEIKSYSLTKYKQPTRSCGCLRKEKVSAIGKRTIYDNSAQRIATNEKYNTNFQIIEREFPGRNNRSGYKGVWYDPVRGIYEAYIGLHGRKISLGRFHCKDDAVKARKCAEDELYAPLIAAKQANL